MFQEGPSVPTKRLRIDSYSSSSKMADGGDENGINGVSLDKNPEHFTRIMHGLNKLKKERVLCDVTLIAEGLNRIAFSRYVFHIKEVSCFFNKTFYKNRKNDAHLFSFF